MSDLNIFSLPLEVIEGILRFLPITDILKFSQTCSTFRRNVIGLNCLWMKKTLQLWPDLKVVSKNQTSWYKIFLDSCMTRKFCWKKINSMYAVSIPDTELDVFWDKACEFEGLGYIYLTSFLKRICLVDVFYSDEECRRRRVNLHHQYYAAIILDYLSQIKLKKLWIEYCNDKEHLTPEKVCAFLSRWIEPKYEESEETNFEYFSTVVKQIEKLLPKNHPYFNIDESVRESWSRKLLDDNAYKNRDVCLQLIKLVRGVLINVEELLVNDEPTINTMIFHNVILKKNRNNVLNIIYFDAILRRFGIKCEPVFFHNHHLLYWRENWSLKTPFFLVDPLNNSVSESAMKCPYSKDNHRLKYCYDPFELLLSLTFHVKELTKQDPQTFPCRSYKNTIELLHYLQPLEVKHLVTLSDIYLDSKKDTSGIREKLSDILKGMYDGHENMSWKAAIKTVNKLNLASFAVVPTEDVSVKVRSKSLKFAIGLVCYHRVYGYYCVIRGWDDVCMASYEWKVSMGVRSLTFGENQPFYQVIAGDLSNRYVAQENLLRCNPPIRMINIEELLALDFSHFNGYHYVPITVKEQQYPADASARLQFKKPWR